MTDIMSFSDALEVASRLRRKHLLLGNGFSISKFPRIFSYGSLFDEADFSDIPHVEQIFRKLGTQDFEAAIKKLQDTADINELYGTKTAGIASSLREDAENLKAVLLNTIASRHPAGPFEIEDASYGCCKRFLRQFIGPVGDYKVAGHVYTLNYDLMLYWTLMHEMEDEEQIELDPTDAFGKDADNSDGFVVYNGYKQSYYQRVHYLHGALHLFDTSTDIKKNTWHDTGVRLIDQTREALEKDYCPIYVAEGESSHKLKKIKHNSYLNRSYDQFKLDVEIKSENDAMFVFGHSLNKTDDHILVPLIRGKLAHIFISVYGDPASEANEAMFANVRRLEKLKGPFSRTAISFFDAESAHVWG